MGCNNYKSTEVAEKNGINNPDVNKKANQETIEANNDNKNIDNDKEDIKEEKQEKKEEKKGTKKEEKNLTGSKKDTKKSTKSSSKKEDNKKDDTKKSQKDVKKSTNSKKEDKPDVLNINTKKKKLTDKDDIRVNTEENKDTISNVLTDAVIKTDHKLKTRKQQYNGVTLMKGIEECFSEDLNEDEILQLVEDALGENIIENKKDQIPGTLTPDQARAVARIIHKKINKKSKDEDEKNGVIDIKNYPELKGVNIEIGVTDLTKEVIRNFLFNGQKVDEYQIDLTYNNLTSSNSNLKALSIQINP